jgi:hypothetical protein
MLFRFVNACTVLLLLPGISIAGAGSEAEVPGAPLGTAMAEAMDHLEAGQFAEAVLVRLLEDGRLSRSELERVKKLIAEKEREGKA